jgi:inositol 1,4,5-triphosphate receptor type 1
MPKLLLAVMESRDDSENAERILYNMNPRQLVDVACKAYHQKLVGGEEAASPKEVGHNIYILCHQLAQHSKELAALMKPPPVDGVSGDAALQYYANHTAQIEIVRHDRTMEQVVFPIPEMCEYLTNDTKVRAFNTTERDDQGSKVAAFFEGVEHTFEEMKWQRNYEDSHSSFGSAHTCPSGVKSSSTWPSLST